MTPAEPGLFTSIDCWFTKGFEPPDLNDANPVLGAFDCGAYLVVNKVGFGTQRPTVAPAKGLLTEAMLKRVRFEMVHERRPAPQVTP